MHSVKEILLSRDLPSRPVMMVIVQDLNIRDQHEVARQVKDLSSKNFEKPDGKHTSLYAKTSHLNFNT